MYSGKGSKSIQCTGTGACLLCLEASRQECVCVCHPSGGRVATGEPTAPEIRRRSFRPATVIKFFHKCSCGSGGSLARWRPRLVNLLSPICDLPSERASGGNASPFALMSRCFERLHLIRGDSERKVTRWLTALLVLAPRLLRSEAAVHLTGSTVCSEKRFLPERS